MTFFADRGVFTKRKLATLAESVRSRLADDQKRILRDTCVYVVGSGGRGEMSAHSDVDLFVARVDRAPSDVDAFLVQHAIAQSLFELDLPAPSQGGGFLRMHTAKSLCERMGTPEDDATNTFTARMLLLLESRALVGDDVYASLVQKVLDAYWQNAKGHEDDYQPFVLVNDVVRYWRILLLNYVAKNTEKAKELAEPERGAERRLRSYKLRHSRAMTCFSTLAAILAQTSKGGVRCDDVVRIVGQRPVERLQSARNSSTESAVARILELYEKFLRTTDIEKAALTARFTDKAFREEAAKDGDDFGTAIFDLLLALGHEGRARDLFRYMVV